MASEGDPIKKLKRENRKLREQLELAKSELETLRQRNEELLQNCRVMESVVRNAYGDKINVDFDNFKLCTGEKCVEFSSYSELLIALKIIKLFL